VLEHVPRPIAVLEHFHDVLRPGGHRVFDSIESEATGFDTGAALRDRRAALEFVGTRFDVVAGRIPLPEREGEPVDGEPVVVRKRRS
jgi:2-polyprenyl-3-methyl-5-hydroxy-6-metoxy-1,4-benzoquinol methylase